MKCRNCDMHPKGPLVGLVGADTADQSDHGPWCASSRGALAGTVLLSLTFMASGSAFAAVPPDVDGRLYGDGENGVYDLKGTALDGFGRLWTYTDAGVLYVAVEVTRGKNDNVFGEVSASSDKPYLLDAGWKGVGNQHDAKALIQSEHMTIRLICDENEYEWSQDYVYNLINQDGEGETGKPRTDWLSDNLGTDGTALPAGLVLIDQASSMQWNFNHSTWDFSLGGTRTTNITWKSVDSCPPDDASTCPGGNNLVTDEEGYPAGLTPITYNSSYDYEWPVVYELSVDLGATAGCADASTIQVELVSAHNSPPKEGDPDVPIIETFDWGDAPDDGVLGSYGTLAANNGPSHDIPVDDPRMGVRVDGETDGIPSDFAEGDDFNAPPPNDDEDGVVSPVNTTNIAGFPDVLNHDVIGFISTQSGEVQIRVNNPGPAELTLYLCGWIDYDMNGTFDLDERDCDVITLGADEITDGGAIPHVTLFDGSTVPESPVAPGDAYETYARFRLSTDESAVESPNGSAPNGEIEDWYVEVAATPTAVSLDSFRTCRVPGEGRRWAVEVTWSEDIPTGSVFELSRYRGRLDRNPRIIPVASFILPDGPFSSTYSVVDQRASQGRNNYLLKDLANGDEYFFRGVKVERRCD